MNPLKLRYVKGLMVDKSASDILKKMKELEKIGKGKGNDMYDALAIILEENSRPK